MRRYKHNLTHFRNTTCDMGKIVPIGAVEVVRGDTFKHNTSLFMRLSPLVKPVMHPVHCYVQHIFVPYRLLWDKWEDFITGGEDFDDASVVPTITFDGTGDNPDPVAAGDLANQLGLPVGFSGTVNAFFFRALALYYNEFLRDDQLQDEVGFSTDSGADTTTNTDILNCNWNKDPFTKARPDDQLGADVSLPLGGNAPVTLDSSASGTAGKFLKADQTSYGSTGAVGYGSNDAIENGGGTDGVYDPNGTLFADLSSATASTINELRLAIATQQWQERINISGNKYQDYLRRYGIKYSDARIDRPEYLAGGKQTIQFSEVIQTAPSIDDTSSEGVASLKGHGIAALRSNNYMKFFEEDGVVLTLMMVKPIPMYMQAVPRHFLRRTKEEFYQKEYEILGMQEITNQEVKYDHSTPNGTFAYQPRFEDYRSIANTVHGEFSDTSNTEMMSYHMARVLSGDVALNSSFITCNPTNRIFADTNVNQLQVTVQNRIAARRLIPLKHKPSGLSLNRI